VLERGLRVEDRNAREERQGLFVPPRVISATTVTCNRGLLLRNPTVITLREGGNTREGGRGLLLPPLHASFTPTRVFWMSASSMGTHTTCTTRGIPEPRQDMNIHLVLNDMHMFKQNTQSCYQPYMPIKYNTHPCINHVQKFKWNTHTPLLSTVCTSYSRI